MTNLQNGRNEGTDMLINLIHKCKHADRNNVLTEAIFVSGLVQRRPAPRRSFHGECCQQTAERQDEYS